MEREREVPESEAPRKRKCVAEREGEVGERGRERRREWDILKKRVRRQEQGRGRKRTRGAEN